MDIFMNFYIQPMDMVYLEMALVFTVWTVFMIILKGGIRRTAGVIFFVLAVLMILTVTLLRRSSSVYLGVNKIPFYTFEKAKIQPELYRTLIMNLFMFVPFGMSFPFSLPEKIRFKFLITVLSAAVFSTAVETCQYVFKLGMFDIDDVIFNALGAALGYFSFAICIKVSSFIKRHNERRG